MLSLLCLKVNDYLIATYLSYTQPDKARTDNMRYCITVHPSSYRYPHPLLI
jgi:hypothetical protein